MRICFLIKALMVIHSEGIDAQQWNWLAMQAAGAFDEKSPEWC